MVIFLGLMQLAIACIAVSLALTRTNGLVKYLRILTSIELFFNARFYAQHPYFFTLMEEQGEHFANYLKNFLSMTSLDTNLTDIALFRQDAMIIVGHHFYVFQVFPQ